MAEGEPPRRNGGRKTLDIAASLPASLVSGRSNERSVNLPAAYPLLSDLPGHLLRSRIWSLGDHESLKRQKSPPVEPKVSSLKQWMNNDGRSGAEDGH